VSVSPRAATVSTTRLPGPLDTVTVGVVVLSPALAKVPRGVVWSTSAKDVAPPPKTAAEVMVTVTVAAPLGGASRDHISIRFWLPWPFCVPTSERLWAP
jgi:hypothetical protein